MKNVRLSELFFTILDVENSRLFPRALQVIVVYIRFHKTTITDNRQQKLHLYEQCDGH